MFKELLDFSSASMGHPSLSSLFSIGQGFMEEEGRRLEQKYAAALSSLGLVERHIRKD